MPEVAAAFQRQCTDMTATGAVDGCFVDGCEATPGPLSPQTHAAYGSAKPAALAQLQQRVPGMVICGSGGGFLPGMGATQVQNWGKHGDYSQREIPMLQRAVAAGVVFEAHGSAVCAHGGDPHHAAVQTELAAFLVAVGPHSYYMCGGWGGTVPTWYPVYDQPLGAPVANATLDDGVYRRAFTSGTRVTYDTKSETGTIEWA